MSTFALPPGTVVSSSQRSYTVQSVLGQGGFGITYLVDTELKMGKLSYTAHFALKEHFLQMLCEREATSNHVRFLQSASKEVEGSKRAFLSEAQRLQRLGIDHRNIVNVDEVFEANGTAYYVMEYLDGGSLADYVKTHGGRLSWVETTALMQPICEAVAMLHRNRVAHYDIKPLNIMVMTDKQGLRPVLIDFGLAKHYDGQGEATSTLAAGGYTPGYAPMEQYAGLKQFAPTADVYALAATICFCLTGHAPTAAADLDLDALCDELLSLGVDPTVVNVLLKAMEYRPKSRPADASVLTRSLFQPAPKPTPQTKPTPISRSTVRMEPQAQTPTIVHHSDKPVSDTPFRQSEVTPQFPSTYAVDFSKPRKKWLELVAVGIVVAVIIAVVIGLSGLSEESNSEDSEECQGTEYAQFRTTPRNLDLQAHYNGDTCYISQSEWNELGDAIKGRITKLGLVINYTRRKFIVKLTMERHGHGYRWEDPKYFTWNEAYELVSKMTDGWRLPTRREGEDMAKQYKNVNSALETFGGDNNYFYWADDGLYRNRASYFYLSNGNVGDYYTDYFSCVRVVRDF
ncbi:MAG: protein kinase [Muribaculaceae bacterium]